MKIAMLSGPWIKVPPVGYGGAELVVHQLTEGLISKGHDVTLFATGDSQTSAKLEYIYQQALGNDVQLKLNIHNILNHLYHFMKDTAPKGFDIIHNHAQRTAYYFLDLQKTPFLHTLHGNYTSSNDIMVRNTSGMSFFEQFKNHPYVSISYRQQAEMPGLNYIGTVYNSVRAEDFSFSELGGTALTWLGRVTPTKGTDIALQVAKKMQKILNIAAWIDKGDQEYFQKEVFPLLNDPLVHYLHEVKTPDEKSALFGKARALLYPLQWEEPFGLVMVESMACGTPVIAYSRGSVSELIEDGKTGFLVNPSEDDRRGEYIVKKSGVEGIEEAVERMYALPQSEYMEMRKNCRERVELYFTIKKMVEGYEKMYEAVLS